MRAPVALAAALALAVAPAASRAEKTQKPVLHAKRWLAITGKPLAATAGAKMFEKGGNAVDAACAMLAAVSTMWDVLSWGGETQVLVYDPRAKKVVGVNALGVAPTGATADFFKKQGMKYPPEYGPLSAVTPGTPGGLMVMLAEYGKLRLADVLAPAIELADGYPIDRETADSIERNKDKLRAWPYSRAVFLPHAGERREAPAAGEIFKQPDLAATLRKLVEAEAKALAQGKDRKQAIQAAYDRFYRGDIARELVRAVREQGGLFTLEDLDRWKVRLEEPVKTDYRGIEVHKLTHWVQGPVMLQALNILETLDLKSMGYGSARYTHALYQAMNLAFADRDFYYGDPYFPPAEPIRGLLSKEYAKERARLIDWERNDPGVKPGDPYPFQGEKNPYVALLGKNDLTGGRDEAAPPSPPLAPGQPHPAAPTLAYTSCGAVGRKRTHATQHREEGVVYRRIRLRAAQAGEDRRHHVARDRLLVRPVRGAGVPGVRDVHDPGDERDRLAAQPLGVARPIPALVVAADGREGGLQELDPRDDLRADGGMVADERHLLRREDAPLREDGVRDPDLADVVQDPAVLEVRERLLGEPELAPDLHRERRNPLGVAARVGILRVHRGGEAADGGEIPALERRDEPPVLAVVAGELPRHVVEGVREVPDLVPRGDVHLPPEAAARDVQRPADALGERARHAPGDEPGEDRGEEQRGPRRDEGAAAERAVLADEERSRDRGRDHAREHEEQEQRPVELQIDRPHCGRVARARARARPRRVTGFSRSTSTASAPSIARKLAPLIAVRSTAGARTPRSRSACSASRPESFGMSRSRMRTSGASRAQRSIACDPFSAATTACPSSASRSASIVRTRRSSSAMRTFNVFPRREQG